MPSETAFTTARALGLGLLAATLGFSAPTASAAPPKTQTQTLASCEAAVTAAPTKRESWGCFYDHARARGDWAATETALRASLAAINPSPDEPLTSGYAHLSLANVVSELDNAAGIAIYEDAADELERGGDSLALTLTLLNLAHRYRVAGTPARSSEALRRAERAAELHGEARWIATVKVERVRHTLRVGGDLGESARLLAEVEPLLFPDGNFQAQINWLDASTQVYRARGQLDKARALADRHLAVVEAAGDPYSEAAVRHNRSTIMIQQALRRGELEPSDAMLAEIETAVAVGEAGSNRWSSLGLRQRQAEFLLWRGEGEAAEALARRCVADARELGDARLEIQAALGLIHALLYAGVALDDARRAEIAALLAEAKDRARGSENRRAEITVLGVEAELGWLAGPSEEAIAASEAQLTALDQLGVEQSDPITRAEFRGARSGAYEHYVDQLLRAAVAEGSAADRRRWISAAFDVGERFRARALFDSLHATGATGATGTSDPALLAEFNQVQHRLSEPTLEPAERAAVLAQLEELERRELALLAATPEPEFQPPAANLTELQAALGEHEALLVYQLPTPQDFGTTLQPRPWLLVLTRDLAEPIELASLAELLPRLAMFGPLLERRDPSIDAAAAKLGNLLLADGLARLPPDIDRLTLVLDGALHQLAFASLRPGPSAPPLIERYALATAPSASILGLWRGAQGPTRAATSLLALADPPVRGAESVPVGSVAERGASLVDGLSLARLPLARREAALAAHVDSDRVWLGAEASEAALRDVDLAPFAVVHFATHAVVDELNPGRSAIVLASDDDDGLLQPREIVELELDGKLIVLSACSTARGLVVDGEGVMGLSHALFGAGARAVVASLWAVRDDDALALFERFYVHLDAGLDVATALRLAQIDRATAGAPPAAWSGVVVLGDGAMVPFPGGRIPVEAGPAAEAELPDDRIRRGLLGGVALVLLVVSGLVYLRRR